MPSGCSSQFLQIEEPTLWDRCSVCACLTLLKINADLKSALQQVLTKIYDLIRYLVPSRYSRENKCQFTFQIYLRTSNYRKKTVRSSQMLITKYNQSKNPRNLSLFTTADAESQALDFLTIHLHKFKKKQLLLHAANLPLCIKHNALDTYR